VLIAIYSNNKNVATARRPRNRGDWYCNRDIECRPVWGAGRSAYFEAMDKSEFLIAHRARNHEGVPIFILKEEFESMTLVRFLPVDLNYACDCNWLRGTNMAPCSSQEKEETFSNLCTIRQKNLRPHALRSDSPARCGYRQIEFWRRRHA